MRNILLIVTTAFLLIGCNQREQTTAPREFVDTTITVRFGETVTIPNTNLSILFDSNIVDNRLPSGVQVQWWSNTAQLGMTVMPTGQKLQLYISGEIIDSTGVSFFGQPVHLDDFEYHILSLEPLPVDQLVKIPDSELVATIRVAKSTKVTSPDSSFYPVALGNRWIYVDTILQEGVFTGTSIDTFTITDSYTDMDGEWWGLSRRFGSFYGGALMVHDNAVFTPERGEGPSAPGYPFTFAARLLIPPVGDSSAYTIIYEGDMMYLRTVETLDSVVTTPCGSFDSTWEYRTALPGWEDMETFILKPGIGIVYMQFDLTFPYHPPMTHRVWLTEYLIK